MVVAVVAVALVIVALDVVVVHFDVVALVVVALVGVAVSPGVVARRHVIVTFGVGAVVVEMSVAMVVKVMVVNVAVTGVMGAVDVEIAAATVAVVLYTTHTLVITHTISIVNDKSCKYFVLDELTVSVIGHSHTEAQRQAQQGLEQMIISLFIHI